MVVLQRPISLLRLFFPSELAAADRREDAGGGGAERREGEDGLHGGELPRPLRAGLHAGAPGINLHHLLHTNMAVI